MARFTVFDFLKDKWGVVPPVVNADLAGKNVLVIGANTGLGLEAARHFATMNPARLFLGCRNQTKGDAAVQDIENTTGYHNTTLWLIDLSNFTSVVEFTERFDAEDIKLDIVVANAGVMPNRYEVSPEGWEQWFKHSLQVNHLSTALLSLLLLPRMARAAADGLSKPRLVIVSSEVHFWTKIPEIVTTTPHILQKMNEESYYKSIGTTTRYYESKLLNVFLVHALASRLSSNSPIIVNAVHPGHCKSGLFRELTFPRSAIYALIEFIFAKSCEKGSRNLVWAAVGSPETARGKDDGDKLPSLRGAFVSHAQVEECSDYALSDEGKAVEERIWTETVEILSKVSPKVSTIIDNLHSL